MTAFDPPAVRAFVADLSARMDRCDNGEGTECASIDASLGHYAALCCEYSESVRAWGRAVFKGEVEFDSETEQVLRDEGYKLCRRAFSLLSYGEKSEASCYQLEGQNQLRAALGDLDRLLTHWVTPSRAVGPAGRVPVPPDSMAEAQRQLDALPPLPHDWQPIDLRQRSILRKLRRPATP